MIASTGRSGSNNVVRDFASFQEQIVKEYRQRASWSMKYGEELERKRIARNGADESRDVASDYFFLLLQKNAEQFGHAPPALQERLGLRNGPSAPTSKDQLPWGDHALPSAPPEPRVPHRNGLHPSSSRRGQEAHRAEAPAMTTPPASHGVRPEGAFLAAQAKASVSPQKAAASPGKAPAIGTPTRPPVLPALAVAGRGGMSPASKSPRAPAPSGAGAGPSPLRPGEGSPRRALLAGGGESKSFSSPRPRVLPAKALRSSSARH
eukprot:tig00000718_g3733.t1